MTCRMNYSEWVIEANIMLLLSFVISLLSFKLADRVNSEACQLYNSLVEIMQRVGLKNGDEMAEEAGVGLVTYVADAYLRDHPYDLAVILQFLSLCTDLGCCQYEGINYVLHGLVQRFQNNSSLVAKQLFLHNYTSSTRDTTKSKCYEWS